MQLKHKQRVDPLRSVILNDSDKFASHENDETDTRDKLDIRFLGHVEGRVEVLWEATKEQ